MLWVRLPRHGGAIALSYPPIVIDDSWKNAAESFTVAQTLTLGGYESAIAPNFLKIRVTSAEIRMYV